MPSPPATIEARLAALEREVADLRRCGRTHSPAPAPARLTNAQAAVVLGCSTRQVSRYAARGLLVRLAKPDGASKNAATYYHADNVAALAASEDAAREWVARRKYVSSTRGPK